MRGVINNDRCAQRVRHAPTWAPLEAARDQENQKEGETGFSIKFKFQIQVNYSKLQRMDI